MREYITHYDITSYFVAVSLVYSGSARQLGLTIDDLWQKPIGITRGGVVISLSPSAKRAEITPGTPISEAERIRRGLILLPEEPQLYIDKSLEIYEILTREIPYVVPKPGFLDRLLRRRYNRDEWFVNWTTRVDNRREHRQESRRVKMLIEKKTGLPVKVGVAKNAVLAKLASRHFVPTYQFGSDIFEVTEENLTRLIYPRSVDDLQGIGDKRALRLKELGIHTIGDLARAAKDQRSRFDGTMRKLYHAVQLGFDPQMAFDMLYDESLLG